MQNPFEISDSSMFPDNHLNSNMQSHPNQSKVEILKKVKNSQENCGYEEDPDSLAKETNKFVDSFFSEKNLDQNKNDGTHDALSINDISKIKNCKSNIIESETNNQGFDKYYQFFENEGKQEIESLNQILNNKKNREFKGKIS